MSQAKVDQYKKDKANRKEIMAKEKRNKMITKICLGVVSVALLAWIGVSTVDFIRENRPVETIYSQTGEIDNYINNLYVEETEEAVVETTTPIGTEVE